jgi:hypothetical protein
VFAGESVHVSFGEMSGPSQVNFLGIVSPAEKFELVICRDMAPPLSGVKQVPGGNREKQSARTVSTPIPL